MATRTQLVLDSSVVLRACQRGEFAFERNWQLIAPPLLWSEVVSALHEALWRRQVDTTVADDMRSMFDGLPIEPDEPAGLRDEAWRIADQLGLAKTYDCEFVALASIRGCLLVTTDARLRRATDRLGYVVDPVELAARR